MGPVRPPSRQAKGGPSPPPSGGKPTPASWGGGIPFTDGAPRGREQSQGAPPRAGTRSRRCSGSCPTPLRGGPRVTAPHAALAGHGTGWGGGRAPGARPARSGLSPRSQPARAPRRRAAGPGSRIWPSRCNPSYGKRRLCARDLSLSAP